MSRSLTLDGLDFAAEDFSSRLVVLPVTGSLQLVGFGNNAAPIADAGGPYTVAEGNAIYLDARGSTDPEGMPLTYAWDLDADGVFGETVLPQRGAMNRACSPSFPRRFSTTARRPLPFGSLTTPATRTRKRRRLR